MTAGVSEWRSRLEEGLVELRWRRAAADRLWFFENCLFIPSQRDPRGREEFLLFDYQRDDQQILESERFVVVLKCRQIGLSTLVAANVLWLSLFRPGSVSLWISDGQENANKAIGMLDVMWRFMPEWARQRAPELTSDQAGKKEWTFPDGMKSRIRASAGTGKAGASETARLVVLDEFALAEEQDSLLRSAEPTTDAGGSLWIISTARGGHNRFAQTFRSARRGQSKYRPVFHPWMVSRFVNRLAERFGACPACSNTGYRDLPEGRVFCVECVDTTGYDAKMNEFRAQPWLMSADYPTDPDEAFRESGRPRFTLLPDVDDCETAWARGYLDRNGDGNIRFREDPSGALRVRADVLAEGVFGQPPAWRDHVLFVDPATGTGGDYTAGQVLGYDVDGDPEVVAWWHANDVEPLDAARAFDLVGRWFADRQGRAALLAVETTGGWGDAMLVELRAHLDYPRLYSHRPTGHRKRPKPTRLGFGLNRQSRPMVVDRLAEHVSTVDGGPLLGGIYPELRGELATFVRREDGRVAADTGCHDDLVMSLAGGLWVLLESVAATKPADGEKAAPSEVRLSLAGMFDQIEDTRKAESARVDRQTRRYRSLRRRQPAGRRR